MSETNNIYKHIKAILIISLFIFIAFGSMEEEKDVNFGYILSEKKSPIPTKEIIGHYTCCESDLASDDMEYFGHVAIKLNLYNDNTFDLETWEQGKITYLSFGSYKNNVEKIQEADNFGNITDTWYKHYIILNQLRDFGQSGVIQSTVFEYLQQNYDFQNLPKKILVNNNIPSNSWNKNIKCQITENGIILDKFGGNLYWGAQKKNKFKKNSKKAYPNNYYKEIALQSNNEIKSTEINSTNTQTEVQEIDTKRTPKRNTNRIQRVKEKMNKITAKKIQAIINDADGYTNVRSGKSTSSEILFKIYENDVFEILETNMEQEKWWKIKFNNNIGYMHKSRIKIITN